MYCFKSSALYKEQWSLQCDLLSFGTWQMTYSYQIAGLHSIMFKSIFQVLFVSAKAKKMMVLE